MALFTSDVSDALKRLAAKSYATQEERDTFRAGRSSMQAGFAGTFDQLAAYVSGKS